MEMFCLPTVVKFNKLLKQVFSTDYCAKEFSELYLGFKCRKRKKIIKCYVQVEE